MYFLEWCEYIKKETLNFDIFSGPVNTYKNFENELKNGSHTKDFDVHLLTMSYELLSAVGSRQPINYKHVRLILERLSFYINSKNCNAATFCFEQYYEMLCGLKKLFQLRRYNLDENITCFIRLQLKGLAALVQSGIVDFDLLTVLYFFMRWPISTSVKEMQSLVSSLLGALDGMLPLEITNEYFSIILAFLANLDAEHLVPEIKRHYTEVASAWMEKSTSIIMDSYRHRNWILISRSLVLMIALQPVKYSRSFRDMIAARLTGLIDDYSTNLYSLASDQITCINQMILVLKLHEKDIKLLPVQLSVSPSLVENKIVEQFQALIAKEGLKIELETSVSVGVSEIDIVIHVDGKRFALLVEGPMHFYETWEQDFFQTNKTLLRNRCLKELGWTVLTINALFGSSHDYTSSIRSILMTVYPGYEALSKSKERYQQSFSSALPDLVPDEAFQSPLFAALPDLVPEKDEDEDEGLGKSSASSLASIDLGHASENLSPLEQDFLKFKKRTK